MEVEGIGVLSNEKNHHACGCALGIDIDQAGLYAGFGYDSFHPAGDVVQAILA
jgi:hypothetical protein